MIRIFKSVDKKLEEIGFKKVPIDKREQVSWMFSLDLVDKDGIE